MLGRAIADLMEFDTFIHLLAEAFSGRAVRRVESGVVAVCTSSSADLAVTIGACEACVEDYLLKSLAVFPLEISDKGIVPLPVRETIFFKSVFHRPQN